MGCRALGLGFMVQGLDFNLRWTGSGSRNRALRIGFRVEGLGKALPTPDALNALKPKPKLQTLNAKPQIP